MYQRLEYTTIEWRNRHLAMSKLAISNNPFEEGEEKGHLFSNPRFLLGAKYPFTRRNTSRNGAQVLDGSRVETDW